VIERRWKREADIIVVGGGLVAMMATAVAAESGMRVINYRFSEKLPAANPLTLNALTVSHDWLHSGLLLDADLPTARLVRVWGRNMLRTFGIKASSEAGIFVARTAESAHRLRRTAHSLGVPIQEMSSMEAGRIAGPHFSQSSSYAVPDGLFDKAALAGVAQQCSVSAGASIVEVDRSEPIALLPSDTTAGGILVQTAREVAESAVTVLADGGMIPALIEPLRIRHPLAVYRSPLIVMPGPAGLRAGLLVDLDRYLSYVRHDSSASASDIYTISPSRFSSQHGGAQPMTDLLDSHIWSGQGRPESKAVAVAHEVEVAEVQGHKPVLPWIHQFRSEGFPGLIAVVASVANLALWTARKVIRLATGDMRVEG
jgi:glycine/D-amino acid oxidase-like deaminating enzyme